MLSRLYNLYKLYAGHSLMLRLVCCFFYGSVMILLNDAETSFVTVEKNGFRGEIAHRDILTFWANCLSIECDELPDVSAGIDVVLRRY